MLRPEPMMYFRVIVPSAYETELIDALISLGAVHLNPHAYRLSLSLPPLLQAVLEGRVGPNELDVDAALDVVRRNLSESDKLRLEFEAKYREYRELERLKTVLLKLKDWGVDPVVFRSSDKPVVFRLFTGPRSDVERAIRRLSGLKVICRSTPLDGEAALLVIYPRWAEAAVGDATEGAGLRELALPDPLKVPTDEAVRVMEQELLRKRREVLEVLSEVANLMKSAVEYEYASRLELLEQLSKLCRDAPRRLRELREALVDLAALEVCAKLLRGELPPESLGDGVGQLVVRVRGLISRGREEEALGLLPPRVAERLRPVILKVEELEASMRFTEGLAREVAEEVEKEIASARAALERAATLALVEGGVRSGALLRACSERLRRALGWVDRLLRGEVAAEVPPAEDRLILLNKLSEEVAERCREAEAVVNVVRKAREEVLSGAGSLPDEGTLEQLVVAVERCLESLERLLSYGPFIEASIRAQSLIGELRIFRNRRVYIAEGWIPKRFAAQLETCVRERIPRVLYLKVWRLRPGEAAPVKPRVRGMLRYLSKLAYSRDVPSYWEVDPSLLFIALFVAMYGMMFGDMGLGAIILGLGAWLYASKRRLLGMSSESVRFLGSLMVLCGASSMAFGAAYGVAFLVRAWEPALLSPIHDVGKMIEVALIFGVAQLVLAMSLSVVNYLLVRDYFGAVFSGTGLLGLTYYIVGVYLAYNVATSGFDLGCLLREDLLPLTVLEGALLVLVPASHAVRGLLGHKGEVTEGFIELMELLIAYPANSLSYIRLAAFAIAHEIFGVLAEAMAELMGLIPSLVFANLVVLVIEGFAVGIQALRLVYYEFSTKFLRGGGFFFQPLHLSASEEG